MGLKIVIVTSSQPSLNPRMVKEADCLAALGFEVVVVGQFWNEWAEKADKVLLAKRAWKFIQVGGNPSASRFTFLYTRISHKIFRKLFKLGGAKFFAEKVVGRCNHLLYKEAVKQKGALYIGHNPGGLAPAVNAAKKNKVKCGFDAEDFHRHEYSNDPHHPDVVCKALLENKYFPLVDYITTSSPLIVKEYRNIFRTIEFHCILNAFPVQHKITVRQSEPEQPLKLFWFSQTLGHNRGIAEIIEAIGITGLKEIQLNLLANPREENKAFFNSLASRFKLKENQLVYHTPIPSEELFSYASQFDLGMASEPGFGINNNLALSNKLFTYFASGLAILYSNTPGQEDFMSNFPTCGRIYDKKDPHSLAKALTFYYQNRTELNKSKHASYLVGQQSLNWNLESQKFVKVIKDVLDLG